MAVNRNCGGQAENSLRELLVGLLERQIKPLFDCKRPAEDFSDSGVVVHCSTVQTHLDKYELHGRVIRRKPFLCPHHNIQRQTFAKEHLNKPDAFWKQVLWTDEASGTGNISQVEGRMDSVKFQTSQHL
ncbi:hypothetical protein ABVT39_003367 [Epinephelus coioides]